MQKMINTDDLPVMERFEYFHDVVGRTLMPMEIRCDHPESFRAEFRCLELGAVRLSSGVSSALESRRTPKMIRRSDPEMFHLILPLSGQRVLTQDRKETVVGSSELALYNTWRPCHGSVVADDDDTVRGITALFPRTLLPLPLDQIEQLTNTPFSGRTGIGALLSGLLTGLIDDTSQYEAARRAQLGTILVDLLAALLAQALHNGPALPPQAHRRALLAQTHAFIQQRLADPAMTPGMIAAAHHISTRYLHRLFQDHGLTVSGWIRQRRLEHCRRDLANPLLQARPIHAIAANWGFTDAAHFSRAFRAAYGIPPRDYRHLTHHTSACADEPFSARVKSAA